MILRWMGLIWLGALASLARAATYYVAPGGDNGNSGGEFSPWATPGYASKQLAAGDTLVIRAGTYVLTNYYDDIVWTTVSGASNAWITIRGEAGPRPVLQGIGNLSHAVNIADKQFLRIEHLAICSLIDQPYSGGLRTGINGLGDYGHSNIVIRDVEIYHVSESGLTFDGNVSNLVVDSAHIHHTGYSCISGDYNTPSALGWQNVLITNCLLEYAGYFKDGIETNSDWDRPDGVGFETSLGPVTIANTTARNGLGDGLDSKAQNTHIHHCLVANNYGDGIKLWGDNTRVENTLVFGTGYTRPEVITPWCLLVIGTENTNGSFEVVNCTFFDSTNRANNHYSMSVQYDESDTAIRLVLRNNIIAGLGTAWIAGAVNLMVEHTIFFNRAQAVQVEHGASNYTGDQLAGLGTGNVYTNPRFLGPVWGPAGDFHLRPGSPAEAAGTNAPPNDLDGIARGSPPAIGAYEFRADRDADGLPDDWEWDYFQTLTLANAFSDRDGDRFPDLHEYWAGTVPTNEESLLKLTSLRSLPAGLEIRWQSVTGKSYSVVGRTNLSAGAAAQALQSGIQAGAGAVTSWTNPPSMETHSYAIRLDFP